MRDALQKLLPKQGGGWATGQTDFMRSLQVPPRAPKKKSRSKDLLFLFYEAGLERAAPVRRLVQKLRAGEQFLARGKVFLFRSAIRKDCETEQNAYKK